MPCPGQVQKGELLLSIPRVAAIEVDMDEDMEEPREMQFGIQGPGKTDHMDCPYISIH